MVLSFVVLSISGVTVVVEVLPVVGLVVVDVPLLDPEVDDCDGELRDSDVVV